MIMGRKIIWISIIFLLMGLVGCDHDLDTYNSEDSPTEEMETESDAFSVLEAFLNAFNNKDKKQMLELSTTEMRESIERHDYVESLYGLRYAKLESASVYTVYNEDRILVYCKWDNDTLEFVQQLGVQHWSFAILVRENGIWKVDQIGISSP